MAKPVEELQEAVQAAYDRGWREGSDAAWAKIQAVVNELRQAALEPTRPSMAARIDSLRFPERSRNIFARAQINTLQELLECSPEDLLSLTNFGEKSLNEVVLRLHEFGLQLYPENPSPFNRRTGQGFG